MEKNTMMNRCAITICLTIAVFFGGIGSASFADLDRGQNAGKRGDYESALREFLPLATAGDPVAQFHLGSMYDEGQGVPQNHQEAKKWFELAARQGHARAQHNAGNMYFFGKGVPQDYNTAMKWYVLAAERGIGESQYNLGLMYEDGHGVRKDLKKALKWYLASAGNANGSAMTALGIMYATGEGISRNYIYTHMWGELADRNGSPNGFAVQEMSARLLTPSQIEKAQKLARECVAKNYKGC
jgi:uncharacterized protein